ncbi:MAG: succinylglutamate desuccinylase/aspartoacylase family protein [Chloroflexi bacterium]|nr:succinylglutamate desuccinylase/aspartoacylase family protein [Chloroflexota bacterium]
MLIAATASRRTIPILQTTADQSETTLPPTLIAALPGDALPGDAAAIPIAATPFSVTAAAGVRPTIIGQSAGGRPIEAWAFGSGERALILVGGIHGGWERNTVALLEQLIAHFEDAPSDLEPGIRLILIPVANPDGLALGRTAAGRFNANGVDLNRNWSCEWSREAYWRRETVNPGTRAFSEPETQAIANFILAERPNAVLFYHSAADGVFAGNCGGDHGSLAVAALYAEAAGYSCCDGFSAYPVTGTAPTWADGERIPAADVELTQSDQPEFERNLRAIIALQSWLVRTRDAS